MAVTAGKQRDVEYPFSDFLKKTTKLVGNDGFTTENGQTLQNPKKVVAHVRNILLRTNMKRT